MADDSSPKREHLLETLREAEGRADKLEAMGKNIVGAARQAKDAASFEREMFTYLRDDGSLPAETWDREAHRWESWGVVADRVTVLVDASANSLAAVSSTVMAGVSLGASEIVRVLLPPADLKAIEHLRVRFHEGLNRPALAEDVRNELRRLSLDISPHRSVMTFLDQAVKAIEQPVIADGGPPSIFLALRQCTTASLQSSSAGAQSKRRGISSTRRLFRSAGNADCQDYRRIIS